MQVATPRGGVLLGEEAQNPVQVYDPAFLGKPEVVGNGVGEVSSCVSSEPMGTWAPVQALTDTMAGPAASVWAFVASRLSGWQLDGPCVTGGHAEWLHPTVLCEC